jgi:hypothetical protein
MTMPRQLFGRTLTYGAADISARADVVARKLQQFSVVRFGVRCRPISDYYSTAFGHRTDRPRYHFVIELLPVMLHGVRLSNRSLAEACCGVSRVNGSSTDLNRGLKRTFFTFALP